MRPPGRAMWSRRRVVSEHGIPGDAQVEQSVPAVGPPGSSGRSAPRACASLPSTVQRVVGAMGGEHRSAVRAESRSTARAGDSGRSNARRTAHREPEVSDHRRAPGRTDSGRRAARREMRTSVARRASRWVPRDLRQAEQVDRASYPGRFRAERGSGGRRGTARAIPRSRQGVERRYGRRDREVYGRNGGVVSTGRCLDRRRGSSRPDAGSPPDRDERPAEEAGFARGRATGSGRPRSRCGAERPAPNEPARDGQRGAQSSEWWTVWPRPHGELRAAARAAVRAGPSMAGRCRRRPARVGADGGSRRIPGRSSRVRSHPRPSGRGCAGCELRGRQRCAWRTRATPGTCSGRCGPATGSPR